MDLSLPVEQQGNYHAITLKLRQDDPSKFHLKPQRLLQSSHRRKCHSARLCQSDPSSLQRKKTGVGHLFLVAGLLSPPLLSFCAASLGFLIVP